MEGLVSMTDGTKTNFLPTLRMLRTAEDVARLNHAAAADNHAAVWPTHLVEKHGKVAGYASIGAAVPLLVWLDPQQVQARDSLYLLNMAECMAANAGVRNLVVPVETTSPFHPAMEKFGYKRAQKPFDLFLKTL